MISVSILTFLSLYLISYTVYAKKNSKGTLGETHQPSCIKQFLTNSRSKGYGQRLVRLPDEDGVLRFKDEDSNQKKESLSIFFRISPRMNFQ